MRKFFLLIVFLILASVSTIKAVKAETVLEAAANALQPGNWVKITTNNSASVIIKPNGGDILEWSNKGGWDPVGKRAYYCGTSHHGTFINGCVSYDDATNTWSSIGLPAGIVSTPTGNYDETFVHGYDLNTFDTARGDFYVWWNSSLFKYHVATSTWSTIQGGPNIGACQASKQSFIYFPDIDRLVFLNNRCGGYAYYYNPANGTWDNGWDVSINALGNGEYEGQSVYSSQGFILGGNGTMDPLTVWKLNSSRVWSQIANPPQNIADTHSLFVADPASGRPLLLSGESGLMYEYNPKSNTWTNKGVSSLIVTSPNATSAIVVPISNYGVIMLVKSINTQTDVEVWLYKNMTQADGDFTKRCDMPGVVRCFGFNNSSDLGGEGAQNEHGYGNNNGPCFQDPQWGCPTIDNTVSASGGGSMKFITQSGAGAGNQGQWWGNFSPDLSVTFGLNSSFYIQYRERINPTMMREWHQANDAATGPKQHIINVGDLPGCNGVFFGSGGLCAPSAYTADQVITWDNSYVGPYSYSATGFYDLLDYTDANGTHKQHDTGPPYCLYPVPQQGGCFRWVADTWVTFKVKITVGSVWNEYNSGHRLEIWAGVDGQSPLRKIGDSIDAHPGGYLWRNGPIWNETVPGYGKIWLTNYITGQNPADNFGTGYTWYDELIISTEDIADPGQSGPGGGGNGSGGGATGIVKRTCPGGAFSCSRRGFRMRGKGWHY